MLKHQEFLQTQQYLTLWRNVLNRVLPEVCSELLHATFWWNKGIGMIFSTFRDTHPLSFQCPPQVGASLVVILKRSFASPVLSERGFKINDNFKKQCVWSPRWTSRFLGKVKGTVSGPWKIHALTSFCLEQTFSHFPFIVATLSGSVGNNCKVLRNALNGETLIFHYHLHYQLL